MSERVVLRESDESSEDITRWINKRQQLLLVAIKLAVMEDLASLDGSIMSEVKNLTKLYKEQQSEKLDEKKQLLHAGKGKHDPRRMTIILGGMLYDEAEGKGMKSNLPKPNPCKVDLPRRATIYDLFNKAAEVYFDSASDIENMDLADSSGMIIRVDDKDKWMLEKYFTDNNYHPSRHRLFVVLTKPVSEADIFDDDDDDNDIVSHSPKSEPYTLPIIVPCIDCGQNFRTYKPDTNCLMPDGSTQWHVEPQKQCPECDINGYGLFLNEDLFPHLVITSKSDNDEP